MHLPRLCRLHLAGLALPNPGFFTRTIALSNQQLEELIVEDFDTLSLVPLIQALEGVPALQSLQQLAIAVSREGEIARRDSEGWRRQQRRVEDWCARPKGPYGTETRLLASWKMVKVEGCML